MDIKNFYNNLEVSKKKPLLVIGKTKTPAAEYDPFSKKIMINEELIKNLTEIEIKLILCHELGHYLNFGIVFLFKIIGLILMFSIIPFFGMGLLIMQKTNVFMGIFFWLLSFMLGKFIFNLTDDYNEYVADKYSIEVNKINAEDFKLIMENLMLKSNSRKKRNIRRVKRTYNWLKQKGL